MKWIGLTGGIGCGKSSVAKVLRAKGFLVLSADEVVHKLLAHNQEVISEVIGCFGLDVRRGSDGIDRQRLGEIVFANASARVKLEQIIHPRVRDFVQKQKLQAEQQGAEFAFYEVPLLFEKGMESEFDTIVVVNCQPQQQALRMAQRDRISNSQIAQRLSAQLDPIEKVQRADFVIDNSGSKDDLVKAVEEFLLNYQAQE